MSKQTKVESAIERTVDLTTGFILSVLIYEYVILRNDWLFENAILVTTIFTIVSFVRGYLWRRFFNAELHRVVHNIVRRFYVTNR